MPHAEEKVQAMFDLRLSTRELKIIREALCLVPDGAEVISVLDVQEYEACNNYGEGHR